MIENNNTKLSKLQLKLCDGAVNVRQETAREAKTIKFMARSMVLATLPHSNPGDVPAWGRRNGDYSLLIQPGYYIGENGEAVSLGIPYGSIPRLLLCWVTTEAVRTKSRQVNMGKSLSDFLKKIDIMPTGGERGNINRLKKQTIRLFSSSISCVYRGENEFARSGFPIADKTYIWWDPVKANQTSAWQTAITLGEEFFNEIITHPVPIDFRIIKVLKNSSLLLDIYTWLTYRVSYLMKPTVVPWNALAEQFGSNYKRLEDFKVNFNKNLKKVLVMYDVQVNPIMSGLLLKPSRPSVPLNLQI